MTDMTYKHLVQVYSQPSTKDLSKIGLLWRLLFGPLVESNSETDICKCGRYFCDKSDHLTYLLPPNKSVKALALFLPTISRIKNLTKDSKAK